MFWGSLVLGYGTNQFYASARAVLKFLIYFTHLHTHFKQKSRSLLRHNRTDLDDFLQHRGQRHVANHGSEHVVGQPLAEAVVVQLDLALRLQDQVEEGEPEFLETKDLVE